ASTNSGISAKKERKKIASPSGTSPASLIAAYISENASVAPSLSEIPSPGLFMPGSEPASALEPEIGQHGGKDHHADGDGVSQNRMQLRHEGEVHAPDGGEQVRRQEHHRRHRHDLDDVVLLVVDEAQRRVLQIAELRRQERGMVLQRLHVAGDRLDVGANVLAPAALGGLCEEGQHAPDGEQRLAHLAGEVVLAAQPAQDALEVAGAQLVLRIDVEDLAADGFDVGT